MVNLATDLADLAETAMDRRATSLASSPSFAQRRPEDFKKEATKTQSTAIATDRMGFS